MSVLSPAILLMGPTASGKTDLALELCRKLPCDIISVDSALIYRNMDIGTAKPSPQLLREFPHRLVDILEPERSYSAAQFREDALAAMAQISGAGRVPLLVGGTMLYFHALLEGLAAMPVADPGLRQKLQSRGLEQGWEVLHEELARVDPESAARIHPNDPQRLVRALEVFLASGETMTAHRQRQRRSPQQALPYRIAQLAMAPPERGQLYDRIARRFDGMLEQGFIEEVQRLRERPGLNPELPSMRAVGYRQVWAYLQGDIDHSTMRSQGIAATRQLAKRQLTWLRGWSGLEWLDSLDDQCLENALKYIKVNTT